MRCPRHGTATTWTIKCAECEDELASKIQNVLNNISGEPNLGETKDALYHIYLIVKNN